jgi:hypothetical protein
MVAALDHVLARARVVGHHVAVVQHLVAGGGQQEVALGRVIRATFSSASSAMYSRLNSKGSSECQAVVTPTCLSRSFSGSTAGLISTARQPKRSASQVA